MFFFTERIVHTSGIARNHRSSWNILFEMLQGRFNIFLGLNLMFRYFAMAPFNIFINSYFYIFLGANQVVILYFFRGSPSGRVHPDLGRVRPKRRGADLLLGDVRKIAENTNLKFKTTFILSRIWMEPVQVRHAEEHGPPSRLWFKVPGQASFQKAHQVIFPIILGFLWKEISVRLGQVTRISKDNKTLG